MNVCKVGNQTSSQDPQAVNSRAFVGNLNTFQVVKTDVEKIFQKYGRIAGISMHKGYAFVQFTSPFDARSACLGEDAKTLCGQILDVNMVSEPKASVSKLKAQKRQKEKEELVGVQPVLSYYVASTPEGQQICLPVQQAKRQRVEDSNTVTGGCESPDIPMEEEIDMENLKCYSTPDILICGNCRMTFPSLQSMVLHKRHYCKLRFTCKCQDCGEDHEDSDCGPPPEWLECSCCQTEFTDPWDLMEHVQEAHNLNIYQLIGTEDDNNENITTEKTGDNIPNLEDNQTNGIFTS